MTCIRMIQLMKELNFSPKAVGVSTCVSDPATVAVLGDDSRYIMGSSQWDARLRGDSYAESYDDTIAMYPTNITSENAIIDATYSPQLFNDAFAARTGHAPAYQVTTLIDVHCIILILCAIS